MDPDVVMAKDQAVKAHSNRWMNTHLYAYYNQSESENMMMTSLQQGEELPILYLSEQHKAQTLTDAHSHAEVETIN